MLIKLSPQASDYETRISVDGDLLTVDGITYDLSPIPEGGVVEAETPSLGEIKRVDGKVHITLLYKYNSNDCTLAQRFPAPIELEGEMLRDMLEVENVQN